MPAVAGLCATQQLHPWIFHSHKMDADVKAACRQGNLVALRALLDAGANVDAPNDCGGTVLSECISPYYFHQDCLQLLLSRGAVVDHRDNYNRTALTYSCMSQPTAAKILSSYGASRDITDNFGRTAVATARWRRKHDLADWLEETRSWTPLHHLEFITRDYMRTLLRDGASPFARPEPTLPSPLDIARQLKESGRAPPDSNAAVLIIHFDGWRVQHRNLMPEAARGRARALSWIGAKSPLPMVLWTDFIIPKALQVEFTSGM